MKLEGSCHCGAVRFTLESTEPVPYLRCYCSICRKTQGGGGYLINLGGDASTLEVSGEENVRIYRAMIERAGDRRPSRHQRHFCGVCGSHLWAYNDRWPDLVHPVAGAIDSPLPKPPERVHMMAASRAAWVATEGAPGDACFDAYPEESLRDWHVSRGLDG